MARFASGERSSRFDPRIPGEVAENIINATQEVTDRANTVLNATISEINALNDRVDSLQEKHESLQSECEMTSDIVRTNYYAFVEMLVILNRLLKSRLFRFLNRFGKWYTYDKRREHVILYDQWDLTEFLMIEYPSMMDMQ